MCWRQCHIVEVRGILIWVNKGDKREARVFESSWSGELSESSSGLWWAGPHRLSATFMLRPREEHNRYGLIQGRWNSDSLLSETKFMTIVLPECCLDFFPTYKKKRNLFHSPNLLYPKDWTSSSSAKSSVWHNQKHMTEISHTHATGGALSSKQSAWVHKNRNTTGQVHCAKNQLCYPWIQ